MRVHHVSIPDAYVEHGNVDALKKALGIDADSIYEDVRALLEQETDETET